MSIHPEHGTIAWTPASDQLGSTAVTVQVHDSAGATTTQSFSIRVGRTGGPPVITSVAATEAYVGQGYLHSVKTLQTTERVLRIGFSQRLRECKSYRPRVRSHGLLHYSRLANRPLLLR